MHPLVWFALGSLAGALAGPATWTAALGAVVALAILGAVRRGPTARAAGLAAAWTLGLAWAGVVAPTAPPVASPEGVVELAGDVRRLSCDEPDRCYLRLDYATADGVPLPGRVGVGTDGDAQGVAVPGARVRVRAWLRGQRDDRNPGRAWAVAPTTWRWQGRARPGASVVRAGQPSWSSRARQHLLDALTLPGEEVTGFYRAILAGDRSGLRADLRDAFVDSGTAHLLAISGLHLGVVAWGLFHVVLALVLRLAPRIAQAGRPPAVAAAVAGGLLWAYVGAIVPGAATLRAALVATFVLAALVGARVTSARRGLVAAGCAMLVVDPRVALGPSWQLSFAAAGALVAGLPAAMRLARYLAEPGRLPAPEWVRPCRVMLLLASASALTWSATAPLALAWFGQLAPAGLVTNLVAVPLTSLLVVPVGFAWLVVALLLPPLAAWLVPLPTWTAGWLLDLVETWAELAGPSTTVAWPHVAGLAGAGLVVTVAAGRRGRPWAVALGLIALVVTRTGAPERGVLRLTALDVGHGDALLVQLPEGATMLVDTGGSRGDPAGGDALARHVLTPALSRLGVSRLDVLVITHADADHVGAAAQLVGRVPVGEVWLPPCDLHTAAVGSLATRAAAVGARLRVVTRGPPIAWSGARLEVLWPPRGVRRPDGRCDRKRNDAGVVLALEAAGRRLLLAADVEAPTERALVAARAPSLRADVLKVAHHGSRSSSTPAFLDAVAPSVALVTARPGPGPMPPHQPVLTRLHARGARVLITGRDGAAAVRIGPGGGLEAGTVRRGAVPVRPP